MLLKESEPVIHDNTIEYNDGVGMLIKGFSAGDIK
jgi:hypothetical protein